MAENLKKLRTWVFSRASATRNMEITSMYVNDMGYNVTAEKLGRSMRTPYTYVHKHNDTVKRSGFCALCRRTRGEYQNESASRRKEAD